MLSIYIHIPFCDKKCEYCSFQVVPFDTMTEGDLTPGTIVEQYGEALLGEINSWQERLEGQEIKTIYFGGGTPAKMGADWIRRIVDQLEQYCSFEFLEELSIELNPYPADEMLQFVRQMGKQFKDILRLRFSFGLQSFDTEVLQASGRQSTFPGLVDFLRQLAPLKRDNMLFNFDFMAFGKWRENKQGEKVLRSPKSREFLTGFLESSFADSLSLYTLELFPGAAWYQSKTKLEHLQDPVSTASGRRKEFFGTEDEVYDEFVALKELFLDVGYQRYEISNFSLSGKNSIHNRVYWSMGDYIGFGTSAASFFDGSRRTNTGNLFEYLKGNYIDKDTITPLSEQDLLIEKVFLGLRTQEGIDITEDIASVLAEGWEQKLEQWQEQELVSRDQKNLRLLDAGMDVYNSIVTELLKEI